MGHGRQVGPGHDGRDSGQGGRLFGVDALDHGMGMGAALNGAVQHAGEADVGSVLGRAGDLVDTIVADGARADNLVFRIGHG